MIASQRALLSGLLILSIAGCSGGGHSSAPVVPGGSTTTTSTSSTKVTMLISAPIATQSTSRKPQYVSPSTLGVAVWVFVPPATQPSTPTAVADFSASSPACTAGSNGSRTCTISIPAPVGSNVTFVVSTYDQTPSGGQPQGNVLSTNTITGVVITAGQVNSVPLTLNGVPTTLVLSPTAVQVPVGQSNSFTLDVNAKDVDGNYIIGTGSYTNPIALTTTGDPNHTISLSSASVTAPSGSAVTVTFNGGSLTAATITATATGATSASMTVTPSAAVSQVSFTIPGFSTQAVYTTSVSTISRFASNASGSATPTFQIVGGVPMAVAVDSTNQYVVTDNDAINVYPLGATSGPPTQTISGSNTGLCNPDGIAVYNGTMYVADTCAGVLEYSVGASGNVAPVRITGAATGLTAASSIAVTSGGIYVANRTANGTVVVFPLGATGNASPTLTIPSGANSFDALHGPQGIAVDSSGNVYVTSGSSVNNVAVFAPGATTQSYAITGDGVFCAADGIVVDSLGNVWVGNNCVNGSNADKIFEFAAGAANANNPPLTTIGGFPTISFSGISGDFSSLGIDASNNLYVPNSIPNTIVELNPAGAVLSTLTLGPNSAPSEAEGLAFDSAQNLFVANAEDNEIAVFAPGQTSASRHFFATPSLNSCDVRGVAVDAAGHTFASYQCTNAVYEFAANSSGSTTPIVALQGPGASGLSSPEQVALDSSGNLYVANAGNNTVTIYGYGLLGNGTPSATIGGSNTSINAPTGVAVDPAGYVYVLNNGPGTITVFAPGQTGNVVPVRTITNVTSGNGQLAVDAFQNVYVNGGGGFSVYSATANGSVPANVRVQGGGGSGGIAISPTQP